MRLLVIFLLLSSWCFGATSGNTYWDVRTTGNDLNGGSFAFGTSHAKDVNAATDLVINATNNLVVTSVTHNFVAGDVNKNVQVTAGTGWTQGWYVIVSTASNAATLNYSPSAAGNANSGTYSMYSAVNYSENANPQVDIENSAITATCATNTITFTAGHTPSTAEVWNGVHLTATSGVTAGYYQINATNSSTTWTLTGAANACTAGPNSGVIGKMGGSLITIGAAVGGAVALNEIHIQTGTYTLTAVVAIGSKDLAFSGYQTTHGDMGTKPLITTATDSTNLLSTSSGFNHWFSFVNLSFSNTAAIPFSAILSGSGMFFVDSCVFDGFRVGGVDTKSSGSAAAETVYYSRVEVKNSTATGANGAGLMCYSNTIERKPCTVTDSYIHNNASHGIWVKNVGGTGASILDTIVSANNDGIYEDIGTGFLQIENSTIAGNTNDGIGTAAAQNFMQISLVSNIIYGNGGIGVDWSWNTTDTMSFPVANRNNAYGANTGGNRLNLKPGAGDILLTADPFTSSAGGDYSLNTSGKAALGGLGYPGLFPGGLTTSYRDIGAIQTIGGPGTLGGQKTYGTGQ